MQRILVIEQPGPSRASMVALIESAGYTTITADQGSVGISMAQQRPNLVVCGWDLGDMDGHGVLTALRQDAELMLIPFVLVTDRGDRNHLRRSMELGADDCIVRPFSDAELTGAISTRLRLQAALTNRYVSILRNAAERLNRLAHYDSLTDLPNHRLLYQRMSQAISATQGQEHQIALLSLSLDRLRQVNNILGYRAGDELLKAASKRLMASLPQGTTLARLTANQFAIVLVDYADEAAIRQVADNLMDALSRPFSLPGQEVFMTTSIGVAVYPCDSTDLNVLLRQAEAALDCAKRQKSSYCQFYRSDMPVASDQQIKLETWLRYALERDEFEVHYQPQLSLTSGRIEGVEALIRWRHPEQGYISPVEFIPLAEETGLIVPIGQWVLETVCQQAQQWHTHGLGLRHVSVNLSSVQFNQSDLTGQIASILKAHQLAPHFLELEITETALMQDADAAVDTLQQLKAQGIRLAVDDFGTGYSSLSYLKQLPIDTLKIDNCFVRGVVSDPKNQVILTSAIDMGHQLGLSIVAEGVETEAEQAFLSQHRCDYVQGYLLGRPMPPAMLQQRIETQKRPFTWAQALA
ncbi:MAG: EAL domain-containing protein [Cyanobacteria bacterium J06629_9]